MRIHVLGLGSIGTLVTHHLRLANPELPITLIYKRGRIFKGDTAQDHELTVQRDGQETRSRGFNHEIWNKTGEEAMLANSKRVLGVPPENGPAVTPRTSDSDIPSLIVCLKTPATTKALTELAPRLSPSSVITLIQNGMGTYEELCHTIWPNVAKRPQFILGTTTHGATTAIKNKVAITKHTSAAGTGDIKFGIVPDPRKQQDFEAWLWGKSSLDKLSVLEQPSSPRLPLPPAPSSEYRNLADTLSTLLSLDQLGSSLIPYAHLQHEKLFKTALNSLINPLTAVLGAGALPNGSLTRSSPASRIMTQLAQETSDAITASLLAQYAPAQPPADILRLFSADSLSSRALALARDTQYNTSSMAVDVSAGRETEVAYINGRIKALGDANGIRTPCHQMITAMVEHTSLINGGGSAATPSAVRAVRKLKDRRERLLVFDSLPRRFFPKRMELEQERVRATRRQARVMEALREDKTREQIREDRRKRRQDKAILIRESFANHVAEGNVLPTLMGVLKRNTRTSKANSESSATAEPLTSEAEDATSDPSDPPIGASAAAEQQHTHKAETVASAKADATARPADLSPTTSSLDDAIAASQRMSSPSASPQSPFTPYVHRLSIDDMIASAPRQERTWDVPALPPTSRGPLPKKRVPSAPLAISPSSPEEKYQIPGIPTSRPKVMADWMDSMITSAPRAERTWEVPKTAPGQAPRRDMKRSSVSQRQGS
ncbi:ketopantoate reductase PanE/ApbA C terminal-domain-containing protein [Kockovaella imperatae]|uniref:Ketopantoate reductase PanE/ApbA C terminal-domain-containing protein n=1 Tax=Kockovaella imperatae TaxID=4999 RepID=A0A1Y1UNR2_9TREE|nr:ketopantoate reductase PanE/ApbA C terminal-domain-containing protein [Kockovaella imperatae]ORX39106.1 ketopantoate reductase PanE/ApbA C terminal-domain-containing protein [Kockovaella imperatae]